MHLQANFAKKKKSAPDAKVEHRNGYSSRAAKYCNSPAVNRGFSMQGHRQVFLGSHQIAVLDASTAEADGPACTAENHCYYGHIVGASFGKSSLRVEALWFIHPWKSNGNDNANKVVEKNILHEDSVCSLVLILNTIKM